jgi:hypothetical protein
MTTRLLMAMACAAAAGCGASRVEPASVTMLAGHESVAVDTTPKARPRMVPPEAYIRTYLELFGGLAPLAVQQRARGKSNLFDTWDDYLSALGLPDFRVDIPRTTQTNAILIATFERLGIALCDLAAERDLGAKAPPVAERAIYPFDPPAPDDATFAAKFDALHRTFLGYPASLAPPARTERFHQLWSDVVARHQDKGAPKSAFKPEQAGWAVVCYGLIRHPERVVY